MQIASLLEEKQSLEVAHLFYAERENPLNTAKQESIYRAAVESYVSDDLFRMELVKAGFVLTLKCDLTFQFFDIPIVCPRKTGNHSILAM